VAAEARLPVRGRRPLHRRGAVRWPAGRVRRADRELAARRAGAAPARRGCRAGGARRRRGPAPDPRRRGRRRAAPRGAALTELGPRTAVLAQGPHDLPGRRVWAVLYGIACHASFAAAIVAM